MIMGVSERKTPFHNTAEVLRFPGPHKIQVRNLHFPWQYLRVFPGFEHNSLTLLRRNRRRAGGSVFRQSQDLFHSFNLIIPGCIPRSGVPGLLILRYILSYAFKMIVQSRRCLALMFKARRTQLRKNVQVITRPEQFINPCRNSTNM